MSGSFRSWAIVFLLILLHLLLHLGFGVGDMAPDLLTIAVLIGARECRMGTATGFGFVLGLLEDSFSILSFGANAVALSLVGALGSRTRDLFVGDSILFLASYLLIGKWVRDLIHWLASGEGSQAPFVEALLLEAPLAALYAALFGTIALVITSAWGRASR